MLLFFAGAIVGAVVEVIFISLHEHFKCGRGFFSIDYDEETSRENGVTASSVHVALDLESPIFKSNKLVLHKERRS